MQKKYNKKEIAAVAAMAVCALALLKIAVLRSQLLRAMAQMVAADIWALLGALHLQEPMRKICTLPPSLTVLSFLLVFSVIAFFIFCAVPKPFEEMSQLLHTDTERVIGKGLKIYFAQWILVLVFAASIIGAPVALGLFVIFGIFDMVAAIAVALSLGEWVQQWYQGNDRRSVYNFWIGAMVMMFCANVHLVGVTFLLFVFPVLSLGACGILLENKCTICQAVRKKRGIVRRERLRKIILREE